MNLTWQKLSMFNIPTISTNMVWPGLIYVGSFFKISILPFIFLIGVQLLIEWQIIKFATKLPSKDSFVITILMNLTSFAVGTVLIPILDLIKSSSIDLALNSLLTTKNISYSSFGIISLTISYLLVVLITTIIESLVFFVKYKQFNKSKILRWIFIANTITVAISCGYFYSNLKI